MKIQKEIKNSSAKKVFICNVMTQPGETSNFSAADHLKAIYDHTGDKIFDWIVVNEKEISGKSVRRYEEEGAFPVKIDYDELENLNVKIKEEDLLAKSKDNTYLRHNPEKLANVVLNLLKEK